MVTYFWINGIVGGIVVITNLFFSFFDIDTISTVIIGVSLVVLGVLAILCWKNQSIRILSETKFEYTTFLGNKKVYRFDQIQGMRKNKDSITLFVNDEKVHIEGCAILTDELADRFNKAIEKVSKYNN